MPAVGQVGWYSQTGGQHPGLTGLLFPAQDTKAHRGDHSGSVSSRLHHTVYTDRRYFVDSRPQSPPSMCCTCGRLAPIPHYTSCSSNILPYAV